MTPILEEREVMSRLTVPQIRSNRIRFIRQKKEDYR